MLRPILVAAPIYEHRSAGIRVLHMLCKYFNELGRPSFLVFYQFLNDGGIRLFTSRDPALFAPELAGTPVLFETENIEELRGIINSSIVIYPEVIRGNPLHAPRVCRYVLNIPSYPMYESKDDLIVPFSSRYWPTKNPAINIMFQDPIFNDAGTLPAIERKMDCTYIGKGIKYGECFKIPGSVMVERIWPSDKESLAALLRNTRYFYCWDVITQTITDAILCGAIVVVMRWQPIGPDQYSPPEVSESPYAEAYVENNNLLLKYNPQEHEQKRSQFISSYLGATQTNILRVKQFQDLIDQHFPG